VTYVCAAVGHEFGLRNLYFPEGYRRAPELYCGSASLMNDSSEVDEGVRLTVPVVDIDELLNMLGGVTLLKCDIEGAEAEIWPGIRDRANEIEWLVMETHEYYLPNIGAWKEDALRFITSTSRQEKWSLGWP